MQSAQCETCKHYEGALFCPAFRGKIPQEILEGTFVHDKPHKDQVDGQILYEKLNLK